MRDLIEAGDLNGLLRAVDALCSARDWDALLDLAAACEEATERGKQLWPIAAHADYRIALEAPAAYVAEVLEDSDGRFAVGPLSEVAAYGHSWGELREHLRPPVAAYVAQERVLRGETLDGDELAHPEVLGLPLHLAPWEPPYPLATYRHDHVEVAEPMEPAARLLPADARAGKSLAEADIEEALLDLVHPWTAESNGSARAVVMEGSASSAAAALSGRKLRIGPLTPPEVLHLLGWAAASGGAYGRRRGAAYGRYAAWYAAATLAGLSWPPAPEELHQGMERLRWYRWDAGVAEEGWRLRIAVDDPTDEWAAALDAKDQLEMDRAQGGVQAGAKRVRSSG